MSDEKVNLISIEEKEKIVKILKDRGVPQNCPMCQKAKGWSISDGYINLTLQSNMQELRFGGPQIPSIAIICNNCGFISHHAVGVLDLLNKGEEQK